MKFTSKIRMQAVLVGLGTALFFANAAFAQQEVDPTTFEPNPGVLQAQGAPVAQSPIPGGASTAPVVTVRGACRRVRFPLSYRRDKRLSACSGPWKSMPMAVTITATATVYFTTSASSWCAA